MNDETTPRPLDSGSVERDPHPEMRGRLPSGTPSLFGRYMTWRVLGSGTFGRVYLARDSEMGRYVAIKAPKDALEPDKHRAFLREARMIADIHHPNICPVHDVGVQKAGTFALPHEDAWEYACRGGLGNTRPFYFGDKLNGTEANCDGNVLYGTPTKGDYLGRTCAVDFTNDGKYTPHPWRLMHMHGNVFQWCENLYDQANCRVLRGGSWRYYARHCRAANRSRNAPDNRFNNYGVRVCLPLDL